MPITIENQTFIQDRDNEPGDQHVWSRGHDYDINLINCNFIIDRSDPVEEAIKFSNCRDVRIIGGKSEGGIEDCLDAVRGKNYYAEEHIFDIQSWTRYGITFKGNANGLLLKKPVFQGKPTSGILVDLGNWGDYNVDCRIHPRQVPSPRRLRSSSEKTGTVAESSRLRCHRV